MKAKKSLSIILAAALCVSVLAGCGNSDKNSDSSTTGDTGEKISIRILGWSNETDRGYLLDLLKEKIPEINLEYQFIDQKQYDNIVNTQMASGQGPDVLEVGAQATRMAAAGYLEDITNKPVVGKFQETGLARFVLNGKNYAIPMLSWYQGVWYNKDIFKENGVEIPKTFDEWLNICDKLKQEGVKPLAVGAKAWEWTMKPSMGLLLGDYYSEHDSAQFDTDFETGKTTMTEEWLPIVEKWSQMVDRGYITEEMLGLDFDQALDEFATEKAAMIEATCFSEKPLKDKNPDGNFGMFPYPSSKGGTGWLIGGPGSGYAINSASKNKESAMKILETIATEEGQQAMYKGAPGGTYLKGISFELGNSFDDCSDTFAEGNVLVPWNMWYDATSIITEYGKGMQEYIAGNKTIKEVLEAADKKAAEVRANRK